MKRRLLWSGIVVALLAWCHQSMAVAAPELRPSSSALLCSVRPAENAASVWVIGGVVAGKGWVDEGEVRGLIHEGDDLSGWGGPRGPIEPTQIHLLHEGERLTLYTLEAGVVGYAELTDDGEIFRGYEGLHGMRFSASLALDEHQREAVEQATSMPTPWTSYGGPGLQPSMLGVWARGDVEPRWVTGEVLRSDSKTYRQIVSRWLSGKGVPDDVLTTVKILQIVRADIDTDGCDEVFISFYTPGIAYPSQESREHVFSYLVMRDLSGGSEDVKTTVLDYARGDEAHVFGDVFWVDGFCDLDADGVAEVVVHSGYYEGDSSALLRRAGDRFITMLGSGSAP